MNSNNVLAFPVSRIVRDPVLTDMPQTVEELNERTNIMKHLHVQEIVETIMPMLFTQLAIGGFDLSNEDDVKDAAFISESIRSVLCKRYSVEHPFQKIADQVFDDKDGVLSVVDSININLKTDNFVLFADEAEETIPLA